MPASSVQGAAITDPPSEFAFGPGNRPFAELFLEILIFRCFAGNATYYVDN
jgi:hypothetical protein